LRHPSWRWLLYAALLLIGIIVSLGAGEQWITPWHVTDETSRMILWELRLPRLLTALAVGGMLALAGAWFQVLLGNPLAEPYVLGVAGSSAAGAVLALFLSPDSVWLMSVGAFAGAWIGIVVVMFFAPLGRGSLLLAGVVLAAFWSAVIALLMALLPSQSLVLAFGWMLGDVSRSPLPLWLLWLVWGGALAAGVWLSRSLDRLLLGEQHAAALGVDVPRLRQRLLWLASAVTAVAVTAAGTIGFIGLVIPHLTRLLFGSLHRPMLIASAIGGGGLLMIADTLSRTVAAPAELPVGVLTAMVGVPLFLWLLVKRGR